jgi:hypothetical protein
MWVTPLAALNYAFKGHISLSSMALYSLYHLAHYTSVDSALSDNAKLADAHKMEESI